MAVVDQYRASVSGYAEQCRMTERDEAGISDQHVQAECQDRVDQDLGGDVDVIAVAYPERQRRKCDQRDEQRKAIHSRTAGRGIPSGVPVARGRGGWPRSRGRQPGWSIAPIGGIT